MPNLKMMFRFLPAPVIHITSTVRSVGGSSRILFVFVRYTRSIVYIVYKYICTWYLYSIRRVGIVNRQFE